MLFGGTAPEIGGGTTVALIHNSCPGKEHCDISKPAPKGVMGGRKCACVCHNGADKCSEPWTGIPIPLTSPSGR